MGTRKERVILDLDPSPWRRGLHSARGDLALFIRDLDTSNDRATMLVQSALAIAPALVPIGAAAVPALAGLTSQLGFAVAAAGVTVLGFNGVGDALEALNEYQLEPTADNFAKLQEKMRGLGPDAREFVTFLDEITPKLQLLREEAQGVLPGVGLGMDELLDERLPQLRRLVSTIADTSGDLVTQAGLELGSNDWDEFFRFLNTEAQPTLESFARTAGNLFEGLANTWMALDPASDDFTAGLLDWSRGFADATENLDDSERFQAFLDYIRENGPQAVDTLGALGGTVVSLVEAAAPVGAVALPILEATAEVLSAIAESPAGPVLIGAAAGMSAISRAVGLFSIVNGSALAGFLRGAKTDAPGAATGLGRMNSTMSALNSGLRTGVPLLGGLALSLSDVDDKAGVSNTAMFAMMGMLAGPWGAAVGGATGALMDLAASNDALEDALERADQAIESMDVEQLRTALEDLNNEYGKQQGMLAGIGSTSLFAGGAVDIYERIFGKGDEYADKTRQLNTALEVAEGRFTGVASILPTLSREAHQSALAIERQAVALRESRQNARGTAKEFITLGDSLDDSKTSFRGWLRELEKQAEALRNFRINAERAADKGLRQGLIDALREAGPEGALRMRQLANATDDEIDRANRAWQRGQAEIRRYTNEVGGVPPKATTKVEAFVDPALARLAAYQSRLNDLDGDRATTYVETVYTSSGRRFKDVPAAADGGTILGQRHPYRDKAIIAAAPGEEITSNRHGQADRWRPVLKSINADRGDLSAQQLVAQIRATSRFADGGTVGPVYASGGTTVVERVVQPRVHVFVDGKEVRTIVRSEISADRDHERSLDDRD